MRGKRINYPPEDEQMFRGPHSGVYMTGVEVHLRGLDKDDVLADKPVVMLWPVDRKARVWDDRGLSVPVSALDELITALEVVREKVERRGSQRRSG